LLELSTAPAVTDRAPGCMAGRPRRSQVLGLILLMSRTASVKDVTFAEVQDEVRACCVACCVVQGRSDARVPPSTCGERSPTSSTNGTWSRRSVTAPYTWRAM